MKFQIPIIGADVEEIKISDILIKNGDSISDGEPLLVLESAKATMDIPADFNGTVIKILKSAGDSIEEGEDFLDYEPNEKTTQEPTPPEKETPKPSENEQLLTKVSVSESLKEQPMSEKFESKSEAPTVQRESEESFAPVSAQPFVSRLERTYFSEQENKMIRDSEEKFLNLEMQQVHRKKVLRIYASPLARFLVELFNVDISQIAKRTSTGRIDTKIIKEFLESKGVGASIAAPPAMKPMKFGEDPLPDTLFTRFGEIERKKLSKIKAFAARFLTKVAMEIPHVTMFQNSYIDDIFDLYKKAKTKKPDLKISFLAFSVKIIGHLLQKYPNMNASIDLSTNEAIYKKFINVGIAIDTPNGLLVATIPNVVDSDIYEISANIFDLASRARDGKLTGKETTGSTFTISSVSGTATEFFTPILNKPNVGIMGICKAQYKPQVNAKKEIVPMLTMPLSLSFDHRMIDGQEGSMFINEFANLLNNPGDVIKI